MFLFAIVGLQIFWRWQRRW